MIRVVNRIFGPMVIFLIAILCGTISQAAFLTDVPITLVQPDGDTVACFATGDEFYHRVHDANNFTIVKNYQTGYFVYAETEGNGLVATDLIVGRDDPADRSIQPGLVISEEQYLASRHSLDIPDKNAVNAPTTGAVVALTIFIRFSDETEFPRPRSFYDDMFNDSTMAQNSQYNYYKEVSYGQFDLTAHFYPISDASVNLSYQDPHPRAYYQYDSLGNVGYTTFEERALREHTLLKNAIEAVRSEIPVNLEIDADNDDFVDAVNFLIRGDPDGWSSLLWPHRWALFTHEVDINGYQVFDYTFHLDSRLDNGVICHEMFHVLGAPDLYHYKSAFEYLHPVAKWGLMDEQDDFPAHMGGYMKFRYGKWIDSIPWITRPGTYQLNPLTDEVGNLFKIPSPNSRSEYFIVEYRDESTSLFELGLPGSGLLVYRINGLLHGEGNAQGPPDEVYIYRKYGWIDANGIDVAAEFSIEEGRTEFNDSTITFCFLSEGNFCGISLSNIGSAGDTISFDLESDQLLYGSVYDGNFGPLTVEGGPYIIGEEVIVPEGQTLTIGPGTTLIFFAGGKITANGLLIADGTTTPIEITDPGMDANSHLRITKKLQLQNGGSLKIH